MKSKILSLTIPLFIIGCGTKDDNDNDEKTSNIVETPSVITPAALADGKNSNDVTPHKMSLSTTHVEPKGETPLQGDNIEHKADEGIPQNGVKKDNAGQKAKGNPQKNKAEGKPKKNKADDDRFNQFFEEIKKQPSLDYLLTAFQHLPSEINKNEFAKKIADRIAYSPQKLVWKNLDGRKIILFDSNKDGKSSKLIKQIIAFRNAGIPIDWNKIIRNTLQVKYRTDDDLIEWFGELEENEARGSGLNELFVFKKNQVDGRYKFEIGGYSLWHNFSLNSEGLLKLLTVLKKVGILENLKISSLSNDGILNFFCNSKEELNFFLGECTTKAQCQFIKYMFPDFHFNKIVLGGDHFVANFLYEKNSFSINFQFAEFSSSSVLEFLSTFSNQQLFICSKDGNGITINGSKITIDDRANPRIFFSQISNLLKKGTMSFSPNSEPFIIRYRDVFGNGRSHTLDLLYGKNNVDFADYGENQLYDFVEIVKTLIKSGMLRWINEGDIIPANTDVERVKDNSIKIGNQEFVVD